MLSEQTDAPDSKMCLVRVLLVAEGPWFVHGQRVGGRPAISPQPHKSCLEKKRFQPSRFMLPFDLPPSSSGVLKVWTTLVKRSMWHQKPQERPDGTGQMPTYYLQARNCSSQAKSSCCQDPNERLGTVRSSRPLPVSKSRVGRHKFENKQDAREKQAAAYRAFLQTWGESTAPGWSIRLKEEIAPS